MEDEVDRKPVSHPRWRRLLRRVVLWGGGAIALAFLLLLVAYFRSDNACDEPSAGPPSNPMRAVVYCDYGDADVLRLESVEKPTPIAGEILVKVHAASLNPLDWHFMRGTPYFMRAQSGLRKPKVTRLGVDFAGTVEAVGKGVTRFEPGDEVFGAKTGALADYVCIPEDRAVVRTPANLTFEQAAAIPIAAITALQALRDRGKVQPGEKVLINGASGGVGTFAVQIAKSLGADVTGVCSTKNLDLVRSLGAERVIDYTKEDFAKDDRRYDLVVDNVGNRSLSDLRRVLGPKGRCLLIGGGGPNDGRWIGPMGRLLDAAVMSRFVSQDFDFFIAQMKKKDLAALADLVQAGKVTPVIDRRYPLSEVQAAMRYLEGGHARGKVVVTME